MFFGQNSRWLVRWYQSATCQSSADQRQLAKKTASSTEEFKLATHCGPSELHPVKGRRQDYPFAREDGHWHTVDLSGRSE